MYHLSIVDINNINSRGIIINNNKLITMSTVIVTSAEPLSKICAARNVPLSTPIKTDDFSSNTKFTNIHNKIEPCTISVKGGDYIV